MHLVESVVSANLQGAAIIGRESCMCRSYKVHNGNWWMQRLSQQEGSTSRSESCYLEHVEKELFLGGEKNKSQRGWDPQTVASAASTRYTVRTLGWGTSMTFTQFGQEWSKHVQRLCCARVNKMPLGHYGFSEYKQSLALHFTNNHSFQYDWALVRNKNTEYKIRWQISFHRYTFIWKSDRPYRFDLIWILHFDHVNYNNNNKKQLKEKRKQMNFVVRMFRELNKVFFFKKDRKCMNT